MSWLPQAVVDAATTLVVVAAAAASAGAMSRHRMSSYPDGNW